MTSSAKFNYYQALPNLISLLRAVLSILIALFLLSDDRYLHVFALFLFILAAYTDYLDGWFARKYQVVSDLGKIMDPTADKALILLPLLIFSKLGLVHYAWFFLIMIREIAVTFCRIGWILQGVAVGAEKIGKIKFGFQVATVSAGFLVMLSREFAWPDVLQTTCGVLLGLALYPALLLTVISGITFFAANRQQLRQMNFLRFICAAGVGLVPFMPGTLGSLIGLFMVMMSQPFWAYSSLFVFFLCLSRWAYENLKLPKEADPSFMVLDEVCGIFVTFFLVPLTWQTVVTGFVLFRCFDVIKPFPLKRLEKLHGFWGVMLDDLGAGLYARLCLALIFHEIS